MQLWGIEIIVALQANSRLAGPLDIVSFLGSSQFFTLLIPLLYWCVDTGLGARFTFLLVGGDAFNSLLKLAFHLPRPYWVEARVKALALEPTYGLPSGHAQSSALATIFLARAGRRAWAWGLAAILILAVGLSRVYLGVHFPTDVLAGWLCAAVVLVGFWWAEPKVTVWLKRQTDAGRLLAAFILPVAILLLWGGVSLHLNGVTDPPGWAEFAAQAGPPTPNELVIGPRAADTIMTDVGVLLGAGLGLAAAYGRVRFSARGPVWQRAVRFGLGLIGLFILQFGLDAIFPSEPTVVGYSLRLLRYGLIGFWVTAAAPWLFLRLRLA